MRCKANRRDVTVRAAIFVRIFANTTSHINGPNNNNNNLDTLNNSIVKFAIPEQNVGPT